MTRPLRVDDIERARLEGAREALTAYADEREAHGSIAVVHNVREFIARNYPAPKPPLPTEPGSLLWLNSGRNYAVRKETSWCDTVDGDGMTDEETLRLYPDAVQVFAKTQDEWDTLIAEAEKRGRDKALDEAEAAFEPKFNTSTQPLYTSGVTVIDTGEAKRRLRALRDGEAS